MSTTGLHWNDAAFAVARDGRLVSCSPSIVLADPSRPQLRGQSARGVERLTPRLVSTDHWAALARLGSHVPAATIAIARSELAHRLEETTRSSPLQCAVSAAFDESLDTLLAIARLEQLEIGGFHDAAVLATAAAGLRSTTLVLEIGLAHVTVTRVEPSNGQLRRRAAITKSAMGQLALRQAWLQLIGEAMVLATRFDPLHDAASEQRLYDQLPEAIAHAASTGVCSIELPAGQNGLRIDLARDQFAEAAAEIYRLILQAIHELRPAGQRVNLLIEKSATTFPGFLQRLTELRHCRIFVGVEGSAASLASCLDARPEPDGSVAVNRGCSVELPAAFLAQHAEERAEEIDMSAFPGSVMRAPTHVLWEGRAVALPVDGSLEIGRDPGTGGLRLADGLAGVSRLHCSLRSEAGVVSLIPHASQGTWLNEERVQGRIPVASGDRLRLGHPGVILDFIAVGGAGDGAPQG